MNTTASEDVLILAIESSCDETAASVVKNGRTVLSNGDLIPDRDPYGIWRRSAGDRFQRAYKGDQLCNRAGTDRGKCDS